VRFLTPTENRRLNELIGFLGITLALLAALSLLSYSPRDASLNVSAPPPEARPARNWIGPVGAHGADILFQGFGYAAFLFPVGLCLLGLRWFRSQEVPSPVAKAIGFALLLLMLPALLALWHFPEVRGAVPAGGLLGVVVSSGLTGLLNPMGAHLVVMASFLAGLFLTTSFSFIGAHQWLRGPMGALSRLGIFERLRERYQAWREAREQERLRKRLEEIKIAGRPPVPPPRRPPCPESCGRPESRGVSSLVLVRTVRILFFARSCASSRSAVQSQPPHSSAIGHGAARRSVLGVMTRTSSARANPFLTSVTRTCATSPG